MKRLTVTISSIVAGLLALGSVGSGIVSAQDDSPFPAFDDLNGLEFGVSRSYAMDFDALMETSPNAEGDEPAYRDVINLTGFILEFDSAENAQDGYSVFMESGISTVLTSLGFDNPEVTEEDPDELGEQAHAYSIFNDTGTSSGFVRYTVAQHDAYIFLAIIITETEKTSRDADALIAYLQQAEGDASGTGTFNASGGSTGGLWSLFPPADHALYADLVARGDEVFFPAS